MGKVACDSNNTTTPNNSSITTNTHINPNTNNQGTSTQRIQTDRVSSIVKNIEVEENDMSHDNDKRSLHNDNNTEVFNYTMYTLFNSSNYLSCYSNVASSHSNSTLPLAHHDIPTHANFEKLLLLAHNKQTFKTKCSKYFHTTICKCIRTHESTSSQTRSMPNTSTLTPTIKISTSTFISTKIIIARIFKYLQSPTSIIKIILDKFSHDILNNNNQHTNNKIITIPPTIEISISSSNLYSTIHSPMSESNNRKIYEDIKYSKTRINSITSDKYQH